MLLPKLKKIARKDLPSWVEGVLKNVSGDTQYCFNAGDSTVIEAMKKKHKLKIFAISGYTVYCCDEKNYKSKK